MQTGGKRLEQRRPPLNVDRRLEHALAAKAAADRRAPARGAATRVRGDLDPAVEPAQRVAAEAARRHPADRVDRLRYAVRWSGRRTAWEQVQRQRTGRQLRET